MKKMKYVTGAVNMSLITVLVMLVMLGVALGYGYVSANTFGVEAISGMRAVTKDNEQILSTYTKKVKEAAQVTTMARDDISQVIGAAIQGRYGDNGSKAVFQVLREQNPSLDPALYRKVQQLVESGRDEFKQGQKHLIDLKRTYENNHGYLWRGFWLRAAGFSLAQADEFKVVTDDSTAEAFKTGRENAPIQLR